MEKLSKDFFEGEVLICGVTKADNMYYKRLYKHFSANNVKVYGLPTNPASDVGFETYPDLASLPHVPKCAFVLCDKENVPALVEELKKAGVSRLLFYSTKFVDDSVIKDCEKDGMDVRVGCPLLLYAGATCYLHAAAAGMLEERKK